MAGLSFWLGLNWINPGQSLHKCNTNGQIGWFELSKLEPMCSIDVNEAGPKNAFGSRFNIPFPHSSLGPPQFAVLEWAVFPPSKTLNSPGPW